MILLSLIQCFSALCIAEPLAGIWENGERFVEYIQPKDEKQESMLRIVLKTYYRYVYEDIGDYPVTLTPAEHAENIYRLTIRYPQVKKTMETSVWVHQGGVFNSFYEKYPYTEEPGNQLTEQVQAAEFSKNKNGTGQQADIPDGFWVETGHRKGILIYPQDTPDFLDAFFFMGGEYLKFRYWQGEFEYRQKQAEFRHINGNKISVPKLIRYGGAVYSCITGNGSKLKNYEKGTYVITNKDGARRITLEPRGGGPGSHAAGDTYPHHQYTRIENLPLYYNKADNAFAFGDPFLTRSALADLQQEITKHNRLRRPSPEPLLKADELDFYWERIKNIRENR